MSRLIASASLDEMGADRIAEFISEQALLRKDMEAFVFVYGPNWEGIAAIELHQEDGEGDYFYVLKGAK